MHTKSRMILGLVVTMVCLSSTIANAQGPVNRDGQWGLNAFFGGNSSGFGVRYWLTDGFGLNVGYSFRYSYDTNSGLDSETSNGLGLTLLPCLVTKGNLRLEGLGGLQYSHISFSVEDVNGPDDSNEYSDDRYTAGLGLALEYYFDELPQMTFGATLVGVSFTYAELGPDENKRYPKTVQTSPGIGFGITYYF